jgi:hypothetical protein
MDDPDYHDESFENESSPVATGGDEKNEGSSEYDSGSDWSVDWDDTTGLVTLTEVMKSVVRSCFALIPFDECPYHGAYAFTRVTVPEHGNEDYFEELDSVQIRQLEPGMFEYQFRLSQPNEEEREFEDTNRYWIFFNTTNIFQMANTWRANIDLSIDIDNMESGGIFISAYVGRTLNDEVEHLLSLEETITSTARWDHLFNTMIEPVVRACRLQDEDSERPTDSEGGDQSTDPESGASDMETD